MSEYPDHLNPFKEKKKLGRTLTTSFRELKGFIRQSFRKKKTGKGYHDDSHDVEIRPTKDISSYNTLRNNVLSLPSRPTYSTYTLTSPALPRSRFKERLSRSSLNTFNSSYDERCNPFAEEEGLNPFEEPPVPYRRRKSKNKAPGPPSCSNPDVNAGYGVRGSSKWSLTSSETDYSFDDKSEYSGDATYPRSLKECLDNFNREMTTLNKESFEIGGSSPNILNDRKKFEECDEDVEDNKKYVSYDSIDMNGSKEINNNQPNEPERLAESSETEVPTVNIEENEGHILQNGNGEVDIPLDNQRNEVEFESPKLPDGECAKERIVFSQSENICEIIKEKDETKNENMGSQTFDETSKGLRVDEIKMKYIDEETSNARYTEEDGEESNSPPKQRKYKLDKEVLLGDDSRT